MFFRDSSPTLFVHSRFFDLLLPEWFPTVQGSFVRCRVWLESLTTPFRL